MLYRKRSVGMCRSAEDIIYSSIFMSTIQQLGISTASDPNLRRGGSPVLSIPSDHRPASDVNLREIMSLSSHSASVSVITII